MSKITYADKTNAKTSTLPANQKVSDADMNEIKTSVNSLYRTAETFNTEITFDIEKYLGEYNATSGNLALNLASTGNNAFVKAYFDFIADGVITFSVTGDFRIVENSFLNGTVIPAGKYQVWMLYDGTFVNIQLISITELAVTIDSLSISSNSSYADLTFSEGIYGAPGASSPIVLADLNIVFAQNGGTATAWTASSVKQTDSTSEGSASALAGGETTVRIFGSLTGAADGNETLTVSPTDGSSIYSSGGIAVKDTESAQDNFTDFLPVLIPSLTFAFDEGDVVGTDPVTQWNDSSTNNYNLVSGLVNDPSISAGLVTFDSSNQESLDGSAHIGNYDTDNTGEFVLKVFWDGATSTEYLAYAVSTTNNDKLKIVIQPGGDVQITIKIGSGSNPVVWSGAVPTSAGTYRIFISTDGSNFKCEVNGVDQGVPSSGTDNGDWFANYSTKPTSFFLGLENNNSPAYRDCDIYALYYFSAQLSPTDRANMDAFLS